VTSVIQAVVFDFGGVLVQVYRPEVFRDLEERMALAPGSLSEILWRSPDWRLAEIGAIGDDEYWRRTAHRLGLDAAEAVQRFQGELFSGVEANRRMVELVRRLRGRYRTGLLSNASDILPRLLAERYGLDGLFDVEVISALVGLAKPDPTIFSLLLARLGTEPDATVFVDDYEPNVEAAEALGIRGIHFTGYDALLPALQGRGVMIGA
jgi:putative hydrolase of the HAD superfamily